MKTDKILVKVTATIAIFMVVTLFIYFASKENALDGSWRHTYFFGMILIFCIFGLIGFFIQKRKDKRNKIKNYSFEERCQWMAREIKAGKRDWYLNPLNDESGKYLVVPLSSKNMNEMGGGLHLHTNLDEVNKLIEKEKINNLQTFQTILKYL